MIMDTDTYHHKMNLLLDIDDIYKEIYMNIINKETTKFIQSYKRVIKNENKTWKSLINYKPKIQNINIFYQNWPIGI